MNRLLSAKPLVAAALAVGTLAAASAAHARSDVSFSIGISAPIGYAQPVYAEPQPVYVEPQPVYVQPQPVYVQPREVYVQPRPVYVEPAPAYYGWNQRRWHHRHGPWGDYDGDGVPNRYDRAPANPYRR